MPKFSKKKGRNGRLKKTRTIYRDLMPKIMGGSLANGEFDHPIFTCDSYKVCMMTQYPPNVKEVYSYIEARDGGEYTHTLFFGLQAFIKEYLMKPLTMEHLEQARTLWKAHAFDFDTIKIDEISLYERFKELAIGGGAKYNGFLPICIRAVEEGTIVPIGLPLVAIYNTDPEYFWLTTWLETALLRSVWYPTTVATQDRSIKNVFRHIYS